jgi:hypothetical protein
MQTGGRFLHSNTSIAGPVLEERVVPLTGLCRDNVNVHPADLRVTEVTPDFRTDRRDTTLEAHEQGYQGAARFSGASAPVRSSVFSSSPGENDHPFETDRILEDASTNHLNLRGLRNPGGRMPLPRLQQEDPRQIPIN